MSYGGESNAKRIARAKSWMYMLIQLKSKKPPDQLRALVLSGPIAADVRVLGTMGVPPQNVTAVDIDEKAIKSSMIIEPDADYQLGDVLDVVRRSRKKLIGRKYDLIFLDYCSAISQRTVTKSVRVAKEALINGGIFATGFMYGREGIDAREGVKRSEEHMDRHHEAMLKKYKETGELPLSKAMIRNAERSGFSAEQLAEIITGTMSDPQMRNIIKRVNLLQTMMLDTALTHGMVLFNTGHVSYRSGRRVEDGRSSGVPMLYFFSQGYQFHKSMGRRKLERQYRQLATSFDETGTYFTDHVPDDPDGEYLKKFAIEASEPHGSALAAQLLNLKRQQIAAWKAWETMRGESV